MSESDTPEKQFVFRSADSWFSLPAMAVREVTVAPPMVRVPGCDRVIEGLCRQRSEFIPVISLVGLLEMEPPGTPSENSQMITIEGASAWAVRIAEAAGLETLETMTIAESHGDDDEPTAVMGTALFDDEVIRVLDPVRLYDQAVHALEDHWRDLQATPEATLTDSESET